MEEKVVKKETETISIIGFIISFIMPLVGLILSIIGFSKSKKNNSSTALAIAGLIISIFGCLLWALVIGGAIFAFNLATDNSTLDNMCSKVQACEYSYGNYYNCYYKEGIVDYSVSCRKDQIPNGIVEKNDIEPSEEIENGGYSLEEFENMALNYYEYKTGEKLLKASAIYLENEKVEIKLYSSLDNLNNPVVIYTVNKETLVGQDANGIFVDLTEAITDSL